MVQNKSPLAIGLAFAKAPPESIDAGTDFSFSVAASWPEGFASHGAAYRVSDGGKTRFSGDLPPSSEDGSIAFALAAPQEVGEHRWILTVANAANEKNRRIEGSLTLTFKTIAHATSLAVWNIPSPIIRGMPFEIEIGAKCTAACALAGTAVEIRDETGKLVGTGALSNETVPGTAGLYRIAVSLKAPRKLKLHEWKVGFSPAGTKLAHGAASARFTFVTVVEPAHSVSVKVVNARTKAPIAGAQVRLGIYRAVTGEKGSVRLRVPKGKFPLVVTRAGFEIPEQSLQVSKDVTVRLGAEQLPEEDPFARWTA